MTEIVVFCSVVRWAETLGAELWELAEKVARPEELLNVRTVKRFLAACRNDSRRLARALLARRAARIIRDRVVRMILAVPLARRTVAGGTNHLGHV